MTGADDIDVLQASVEHELDITAYVCPMTFVRTKLLLERMARGERARVRLNGGEPLSNVPRAVGEHGDRVLDLRPEPGAGEDGPFLLLIERG